MEVTAERMVAGGDALAHAPDGRVVLVEGALPGEEARVTVIADRPDHLRARVVEIITAAPARLVPPCPHAREGCGGCTWQHVDPVAQVALKLDIVRDALRRTAHLDNPPLRDPVALPPTGYRTTVRALVVDGRPAFRRARSHGPVAIESCLVAHPLVDDVIRHGDFTGAREVVVRAGAHTGERCVRTFPAHMRVAVAADVRQGRDAHVHEVVHERRLRVSADAFFQTRVDGAEALAALVRDAVGPERSVADLYCGVGLFASQLDEPTRVVAVDHNRAAIADARVNLRDVRAKVVRSVVERWRPTPVDVVVADPGRKGLGRAGARVVSGCEPGRVVLVSCDAAALARDIALLVADGYRATAITLVDLFPHTPHVECVTVLDR